VAFELEEGQNHPIGGDDAELHVTAVFGDEEVTRMGDHEVVDPTQRRGGVQGSVVNHLQAIGAPVVSPNAIVALGRKVDDAVVVPAPLPPLKPVV
jgi:hypothetical protein